MKNNYTFTKKNRRRRSNSRGMRLWHLGWWLFLTKIRRRMSHVAQITNSFMFSGESNPLKRKQFSRWPKFSCYNAFGRFFHNSGKKWKFQKLFCGHKSATGGFYKRKLTKKSTLERLKSTWNLILSRLVNFWSLKLSVGLLNRTRWHLGRNGSRIHRARHHLLCHILALRHVTEKLWQLYICISMLFEARLAVQTWHESSNPPLEHKNEAQNYIKLLYLSSGKFKTRSRPLELRKTWKTFLKTDN